MLERKDDLQSLLTPNKNTILHIYVTSRTTEDSDPTKFVKKILENCPALLMQPNTKNETPLHIAARYGHASIVEMLIKHAKSLHPENLERGVEAAKKMMRIPALNCKEIISEIINWCPECYELVNEEGWNILHSAVQNNNVFQRAMDTILKTNAFSNLLNDKDAQRNTPLHHIAISLNSDRLDELIDHPRVDKMAFNKQNQNALDLASTSKAIELWKKCFIRSLRKHDLRLGIRIKRRLNNEEEENEEA
nr:protein ACCELERATED CELL DEATH 6-like [Ziziphus jujuba var. spinosa]